MEAPVWTFWAAFQISEVWSARKNKTHLLMGRKAQYQKKENRSTKWAYSSANYMFDWVSWEPSSPQSDTSVLMFFFQRNICFHVKLVQFISQKKIFLADMQTHFGIRKSSWNLSDSYYIYITFLFLSLSFASVLILNNYYFHRLWVSLWFSETGRTITISLLFLPSPEIKLFVSVYLLVFVHICVIRGKCVSCMCK